MDVHYIKLAGTEYPACFSMAATEDIVAAFGGLTTMSDELARQDIGSVGKMLGILVNAGYEYCELAGISCPPRPKGRLTALLSIKETEAVVKQLFEIMSEDAGRTVEVRSKNA